MKAIFRLLLVSSLFVIVGCTITKRKYSGGYYLSWHNKTPDTKIIEQSQNIKTVQNKITCSNNSSEKTVTAQKIENPVSQRLVQPVSGKFWDDRGTIYFRNNIIHKPVLTKYIAVPTDTIHGGTISKDTHKRDVRFSWIFFLIGFLIGLLFFPFVVFSPQIVLIFLMPLLSFILSLVYCFKAIQGKNNLGLLIIVIFDIAFIIGLLVGIVWGLIND